jgi:hypothetical protein
VETLYAAYDIDGNHCLDNVDVGGIVLKPNYQHYKLPFLLGLLNSKLLKWYFPYVSAPFRGSVSKQRKIEEKLKFFLNRSRKNAKMLDERFGNSSNFCYI